MTGTSPSSSDCLLEAKNLRVRYPNGALGVLDVSFAASDAQVIALFGANGAGKTTSVRAVSGFLRNEGARTIGGEVLFDGHRLTNAEPHRQAKLGIFFIPERNKVFGNLSVAENLAAMGRPARGPRRRELQEFAFTLFPILAERRRQAAGRLSGGQRQMLALARGILSDPRLLIVDEMTLGLHHSLHPPLFEAVRSIAKQGTTVVLVDESTSFALSVADRCYVLANGVVRKDGLASEFDGTDLVAAGYTDG